MINVNEIWLTVRDLSRKDHAGWTSSDEFNRACVYAENLLFEYYIAFTQANQEISHALDPFMKEVLLDPYPPQYYPFPEDFRYKLNAGAYVIEQTDNTCEGNIVTTNIKPAEEWSADQGLLSLDSPIRKPSIAKMRFAYETISGNFKWWPADYIGKVYLKYYAYPINAVRGYIVNPTTQEEEYDPGTSTNFEWGESERPHIVDLILLYKGLQIRETEIINWVLTKKQNRPENSNIVT